MQHVYSPSGSAEAHMIAHMLEQQGIKAHIHGEALLGAAGELPVSGLMKIAVADEDFEAARKLILEWEKKNPPEISPSALPKPSESAWAAILLVGLIAGWFANSYYEKVGLFAKTAVDKFDQNKDGRDDFIYYYKSENAPFPERSENDSNFDGKVDVVTQYNAQGLPDSDKEDNDFNGVFETTTEFESGYPARSETDTNGDGKPDITYLRVHGILKQIQILDPETGKVKRIGNYQSGILKSADFDSDGDGILETHYTYDRYEQVISTQKNR